MITQLIEKTELSASEAYQVIKDEQLDSIIITSQILAGSRILLSSYRQVVFSDCVFYACDFQGVTFENCVFENCSFEFSHIKKCNFKNCNFTHCNWIATSSQQTSYSGCDLDQKLLSLISTGKNKIFDLRDDDHTTDIYIQLAVA